MRFEHFIQAVIAWAIVFALPGALQLPGFWSGVAVYALGIAISVWALYRSEVHGRGPFW